MKISTKYSLKWISVFLVALITFVAVNLLSSWEAMAKTPVVAKNAKKPVEQSAAPSFRAITTAPMLVTITNCTSYSKADNNQFKYSTSNSTATTLMVSVHVKLTGNLQAPGDYLLFSAGSYTLTNVTASKTSGTIPDGKIIADNTVSAPVTAYDAGTNSWTTRVPLNYSSNEIFISAAVDASTTGYVVGSNQNASIAGQFSTNSATKTQSPFVFAMRTFQPTFTYANIGTAGNILPEGGTVSSVTYPVGFPANQTTNLVQGANYQGSGNVNVSSSGSVTADPICYVPSSSCPSLTHTFFNKFTSTSITQPTTLWVNIHVKLNKELASNGDYLLFSGGSLALSYITASFTNATIPDGRIVADNTVSTPVTTYDAGTNTWITRVPLLYANSDVFISAGALQSTTGFTTNGALGTPGTTLTGKFYSNITSFSESWFYGLAAYRPTFTYAGVAAAGQVNSIGGSGNNGTGTPNSQTANITAGGSSNGTSDYIGNYSSQDNFNVCTGLPASCSLSATVTPGTCTSATNQYTITGSISATNTNSAQSFTVSVGSSSTVVALSGDGTVSYTLAGLNSDGAVKTVNIVSSATNCGTTSVTYTAPSSCSTTVKVVVSMPVCNTATNSYTATATVSATINSGSARALTVTDNGTTIGSTTLAAGQTTTTFTVTGVSGSSPASRTVVATVGVNNPTVSSTTYAVPASCTVCTLSITGGTLPITSLGLPYLTSLTTTGGNAPLSFSVVGGSLPVGLTLNPTTGVISGTATSAGATSFTVRVTDSRSCTASAQFTINVQSNPPTAYPDNQTALSGIPVSVTILANDKDSFGNQATISNVTTPVITVGFLNGTGSINAATGVLSYTSNPGFTGNDVATYRIANPADLTKTSSATVLITVNAGSPTANPDAKPVAVNKSTTVNILLNDKDKVGNSANLTNVTLPVIVTPFSNGTAVINPTTGVMSYTPNAGFTGTDVATYRITDLTDNTKTSTTTVTLTVLPCDNINNSVITAKFTGQNTSLTQTYLLTDADGLILAVSSTPSFSALQDGVYQVYAINSSGTLLGASVGLNVSGISGDCKSIAGPLTYIICNPPPTTMPDNKTTAIGVPVSVTILANDKDRLGNTANLTNVSLPVVTTAFNNGVGSIDATTGVLSYTPNAGFIGNDIAVYQICDLFDPTKCSSTTVTIGVISLAPFANPDTRATTLNTPVTVNVLGNDFDKNGAQATLSNVTKPVTGQPANGTAVVNADGSITYTPRAGYFGPDSFTYTICDIVGITNCSSTTVSIDIQSLPPQANNDEVSTIVNTPVSVSVLGNDFDNVFNPASLTNVSKPTIMGQPTNGTAVVNANGTITYTPNTNYIGPDSFTYTICDLTDVSKCSTANVNVTVMAGPPMAKPDSQTTSFGQSTTICVLANDKDKLNAPATLSNVSLPTASQPTNGTVTVNATTGCIAYTPKPGFTGTDVFSYTICDKTDPTKCSSTTVTITVQTPVSVLPKVYLQGALVGVNSPSILMRDDLRAGGYLPLTHPYAALSPITPSPAMAPSVTAVTGQDAIVDWVFVELRSATNNTLVVDSKAALLQRDGDIVNPDGVSSLTFAQALPGSYYVAVRHRNHLGVMSQNPIALSPTTTTVDFRDPNTLTFTYTGTTSYTQVAINQAQVVVQQGVAMWAGNCLNDNASSAPHNFVIYQGTNNDANQIYQQVINAPGNAFVFPFYKLKGYYTGDVNLNGETIFQGTGNDVELVYQNIIKNHPGNTLIVNFFTIREQLP